MCGICGFAGQGDLTDLGRMTEALRHRGPDGSGFWSDPDAGVFLGHRRLAILDLVGGHQPMVTADGDLIIVFNGEIYNFAELRAELVSRGCRFVTDHSDTEVLLHGFREWGAGLPARLNGMWALVIYDRRQKRVFASRDRFGKKPLFYTLQGGAFVFASELSSLRLHPSVQSGLSPLALKKYFAYGYIPAPHSILAGVHKLPGGHSLWFDLESPTPRLEKYWEFKLEPFEKIPANAEQVWGEELRERLESAVKRRLVADVPVGVFLSGGIDSSAVTAFAARHMPRGQLKTFSMGFAEPSFDESEHARRVATLFGTDHHADRLSLEKAVAILPEIAARLDEPLGDNSLLPTYLLSGATRRHVTVALGGDGGDELFAGYDPFRALRQAERYRRLTPRPVHQAIRMLAARLPVSHRNMSFDFKVKRFLRGMDGPPKLWLPFWMAPLEPAEIAALFHEPADPEEIFSEAIAAWESAGPTDVVSRAIQFYVKTYLQDDILVKIDRASMMHGLEVRAPFLDIELVDFVRKIPSAWKYRGGVTKYILKKALEPLLPAEVLYRKKKGFGAPVGAWLRAGRLDFNSGAWPRALDEGFLRTQLSEHRSGRADHRALLWNAWMLKQWR